MSQDYWCVIVTRDGAETIGATLDSIIHQSIPPKFIVLVNDGSTDDTTRIVQSKALRGMYVLNTGSRIRDIRKVPRLLNLALNFARNEENGLPKMDYMMVSGDDNELSLNYAERLLGRMESDPKLVVTSGEWLTSRVRRGDQMPHGGGRFVKTGYMSEIGGQYPIAYGWETWLLYKALELGYKVRLYPDARYEHLRPFQPPNLFGWGRAMYSLGFPSYFVLLRFLVNLLSSARATQSRQAAVTMLVGFVSAELNPSALKGMIIEDQGLKTFVRYFCTSRLTKLI
ncbi:MAG TPA: glycosyltransferase family A protein [Nitrososphaerales archaeon]|nr:glycosyltransferase family A protein [Nitrososphaerales archaeon]